MILAGRYVARTVGVLVSLVFVAAALTASPAVAAVTNLCAGYADCNAKGYSDSGYGAASGMSY